MIGLANKARLGIPRVNQNPRPPGPHFKNALANRIKAPAFHPHIGLSPAKPLATPSNPTPSATQTTAFASNTAQPQSAPKDPLREAAESAQTQTFQIPSYTPEAGKTDPRDSAYWDQVSKLLSKDNNEYAGALREQSLADASYGQARKEALQNKVIGERQLGEKLIGTGLTASGYHDREEAEGNRLFTNTEAQARGAKEQEDQARATARQALREGFGVDAAAALAEAVGRRGEGEEKEAESGPGEPTKATGPGGAKGQAKSKGGKGKSHIGVGNAKAVSHAPRVGVANNRPASAYKTALANRRKARK